MAQGPSRTHCSSGLAHLSLERAHTGGTYPGGLDLVLQVMHKQREMESQHQEACLTTAE